MQTAPIPKTLQDVRPVVRNMRPDGYILQTGGSATRQIIKAEGDQVAPLFRVTGVPLHTHNASALLEITAGQPSLITREPINMSYKGEFSQESMVLLVGEHYENTSAISVTDEHRMLALRRSIDWGVGRVDLQPENSVNYISEPTRAISEIRTLVSPLTSLDSSTYVDQTHAYVTRSGDSARRVEVDGDIVMVPVMPVNNMHITSELAMHVEVVTAPTERERPAP